MCFLWGLRTFVAVIWFLISVICALLLVYTYLLYPGLMAWMARGKKLPPIEEGAYLPDVSIITAVYNEENVLAEKMQCLLDLDYPRDKLHVYFGSDKSSDRSNAMLEAFAAEHDWVTFVPFDVRQGKIGVINNLGDIVLEERGQREDHVLFYNDANVMLTPAILKIMMRHFKEDSIALVDANMKSRKLRKEGISLAEKAYISSEVLLKHREGLTWGMLQGAFGGCYGLRSTYHTRVPEGFLVDDFYISFNAMVSGGRAINDLDAECFESASHDIWQEFNRKARISAGNFQNLRHFLSRIRSIPIRLLFCFISHKVIRWFGPFLILLFIIGMIGGALSLSAWWMTLAIVITTLTLLVFPLLDIMLSLFGYHLSIFRKVRYFMAMNIALFKGFIRYAKGIRKSFWDPPKRV